MPDSDYRGALIVVSENADFRLLVWKVEPGSCMFLDAERSRDC